MLAVEPKNRNMTPPRGDKQYRHYSSAYTINMANIMNIDINL
jgi:hypothetical protein